ncbi:MAG: metal-dependent hydrolase [Nitrospirota bacterium]
MSPVTHFFISWLVADGAKLERRDRIIVTASGVIPDIDGLGIVADIFMQNANEPFKWYQQFHHVLTHNLAFALIVTIAAFLLAKKRALAASLSFASFHLHLLGDIVGSAGPEGSFWSIPYFWPFSDVEFTWSGQWELNAWQNIVITAIAICLSIFVSWKRGYSLLELFSQKADRYFIEVLRRRFG